MHKIKTFLLIGLLIGTSACTAGPSLDAFRETSPALDLKAYFNGPIKAWGIVQDRNQRVIRRFDVSMNGSWEDNIGTLEEDFEYYDGEKQKRVWTIKKINSSTYEGTASDIAGLANGQVAGSAMRWNYEMDIEVDDNTYRLKFDDWMYLMNDGVLINRSYLKKFGITVAELTLFIQKQKP